MVQKATQGNKNSLWAFSRWGNLRSASFWQRPLALAYKSSSSVGFIQHHKDNAKIKRLSDPAPKSGNRWVYPAPCNGAGFTLIELVVVIGVLAALLTIGIGALNPAAQWGKAKNGQREHDFSQIQSALDTYLNDTGCYPNTIPFGQSWVVGKTTYMEKVPQDPDCSSRNTTNCYRYQIDTTSSCPQWNVLYAELQAPLPQSASCPLTTIPNCTPQNYNPNTDGNYCILSGKVDCAYLAGNPVPTGVVNSGSIPTPTSPPNPPTPTPTSYPVNCQANYYACTGNPSQCNVENPQGACIGHGGSYQCYCSYSDCTTLSACRN